MNAMPLHECKLQQYQLKLLRPPCKFGHDGLKTVRFRCDNNSSTVLEVLKSRGWLQVEGEDESWNLFWCEVTKLRTTLDNRRLEGNQRVPHFRNHYELTRKNLLAKNLKRLRRQCVKEGCREDADMCDCMPVTYELPGEYMMFVEEYRKESDATWIVKPSCGSQGRGIFLFQKLKELTDWRTARSLTEANNKEVLSDWKTQRSHDNIGDQVFSDTHIVQRYIDNPYLIAGRKFDLRIYVLITSFSPLKAWIGREGFARLSNEQFSLSDLSDSRVHLTNSSIQLRSDSGGQGCKWSLRSLREFLTARHGATTVETLVQDIARVVLTSLRCVQNVIIQDRHCFELYGYDVLLDCNLKP
uniref:Tubulin--tyrosine ligase-like protein 9 n=1 Tax=Timema cristinae TaxID=61476 RepID=A0A7R9H7B2_TIMCR|nr:unnamed protein product [Timema cristinae]